MPKRSSEWSEDVSRDLKDLDFAQLFLVALLDEGDDLQTGLGRLIRLYGVKEYAAMVKMNEPAVQRAINSVHNPTKATLERLLAPLKLRLGIKP